MAASRAALLLLVCFVSAATTAENTCDSKVGRDSCGSAAAGSSAEKTQEHQRPANMERTFLMIKPDGVQRGLVGEIIRRFETKGYKLVAFKFMQATEDMLANHYAEHKERTFYDGLLKYIMSGPVVPMVWEGTAVVKTCRNIIGVTNPLNASPGTIRGDYGIDMGRNIIHGSDSPESAHREISIWFTDEELVDWESNQSAWVYE